MKNPLFIRRSLSLILVGSIATLLNGPTAQAASSTWAAAPASANWNAAANWGGTLPASSGSLVFGSSSTTTLNNDLTSGTAWIVPSITFNAEAPAYVISGNTFTLGTSSSNTVLSNNSTSLQTLNNNITLGNAVQYVNLTAGGGDITLGGNITTAGGSTGIFTSGNGTLTFKGTANVGTINLGAATTLKVDGGSLSSSSWGNAALATGTVQVTNGGSFYTGGSYAMNHYLVQDSGLVTLGATSSSTIRKLFLTTTGGTATFVGMAYDGVNLDASGSALVTYNPVTSMVTGADNATLSIGGNASVTFANGLDLAANGSTGNSTINLNGGMLTLGGATPFNKANTASISVINLNGGTLRFSATTNIFNGANANTTFKVLSGGAVIDTQGSSIVTFNKAIVSGTVNDGGLTKLGTGQLILGGVETYTGATTIASGTLVLGSAGTIANSSAIVVGNAGSSGAVLDLTAKSSYNILSGQTVKGIGTLNIGAGKAITVNSGAHWAPGNSIGTLGVTGNLTLAAGSITDIELGNSTGTGTRLDPYNSDRTTVSGALALGGTLNLINNAGANSNGSVGAGSYKIFTQTGSASGSFSAINNVAGFHAKVDTATSGSVIVDNYQIAVANTLPTVNMGITHVSGTFGTSALSIQNTAASNGYGEALNVTKGATTGAASVGGTNISSLAGGSTSTAITVGLSNADTSTVGAKSGTVAVGFSSDGTASGYGTTTLDSQTMTVNGQVNYYADVAFTEVSGGTLTSTDATHYTLSLGTFNAGSGEYTATITLDNVLHDAIYQDLLSGGFDISGQGNFILGGFEATLGTIASGTNATLTVSFNTAGAADGMHYGTVLFNPTSVNTSGTESLSQVSLGLEFEVVPEPATWSMLVGGLGMMALMQRARRRMSR